MSSAKMKFNKLLVRLGIILVLATVATPAILTAPVMAYGQYIIIYPNHGPVGTEVSVRGSLFTPSVLTENLTVATATFAKTYFTDNTTPVKTTIIDAGGHFETSFVVSEYPAGVHQVWVSDESASPPVWVSASFIVEPQITLGKSSGYVGDNITANATGLAATSATTIYFDGLKIATTTTDWNGSFSNVAIIIPESTNGNHNIRAMDASSNNSTSVFTTKQRITISPTSEAVDEEVTIRGNGFAASSNITVTFDGIVVATNPASVKTNQTGNFTGKFFVPTSSTNTYIVAASDGNNKAEDTFVVAFGGKMNRIIGYTGSAVTFSGGGFIPGRIAIVRYDTILVAEAVVDANGNLLAKFKIPASSSGEHTISITDGTNTAKHIFTVFLVADIKINRNIGYVGSDITVSGTRFVPDRIATIYYGDIPVAEAVTDANGNFTTNFKVPAGSSGEHTISATDSINTINSTFTMESIAPPIPVPLLPVTASIIETEIRFAWEGVTDPSGVTYTLQIASDASFTSGNSTSLVLERSKLAVTEYTLTPKEKLEPAKQGAPYYWRVRAIDNASNMGDWSTIQEFYIDTSRTPISPWLLYSLIVEGGVVISLFGYWLVRRKIV